MVRMIDAACIHPEMIEAVLLSLPATEVNFAISSLALAGSHSYIVERQLIFICAPSVREDGVGWNFVDKVFGEPQLSALVELQKAHDSTWIEKFRHRFNRSERM